MLLSFKSRCALALLVGVCAMAPLASAQVIFAPVQYQYGPHPTFYYGGSNPRVFERMAQAGALEYGNARTGWYEGVSGVGIITPRLTSHPPFRVFTDAIPYVNAALYGYTPADARNEANANVPRYFVKADLVDAAVPEAIVPDASERGYFEKQRDRGGVVISSRVLVVPANAQPTGTIQILPYHRRPAPAPQTQPAAAPTTEPRPLLIFPKKLLEKPAAPERTVAAAN